jgi:hypothetical protein
MLTKRELKEVAKSSSKLTGKSMFSITLTILINWSEKEFDKNTEKDIGTVKQELLQEAEGHGMTSQPLYFM